MFSRDRLLMVASLLFTSAAFAADRYWTGGGEDSSWDTSANWDVGVPQSGDVVKFHEDKVNGGRTVVINGKYSYVNLHVCGGTFESPFIFAADGDSSNGLTFSGDVLFGCDGFNSGALRIDSGTYAFNRDTKVGATKGASASLVQNGGLIKHGNNFVFHIGHGEESEGSVENNGGNWSGYHLSLGMGVKSKGRFTQNGGTIEIFSGLHIGRGSLSKCEMELNDVSFEHKNTINIGSGSYSEGKLTVKRGSLSTRGFSVANTSVAALNLDSAILNIREDNSAFAPNNMTITIGKGGAELNTNKKKITIKGPVLGEGKMKFAGGGIVTFEGDVTFEGGTEIDVGTKIVCSKEDAKSAILNGLVVDGRGDLQAGSYDILECPGLSASDLEAIKVVNCGEDAVVRLDNELNPSKIVLFKAADNTVLDGNKTWSELVNGLSLHEKSVVRITVSSDSPTLTINEDVNVAKIQIVGGDASKVSTVNLAFSDGVAFRYEKMELSGSVCCSISSDSFGGPICVEKDSTLRYSSGDFRCVNVSGEGTIEVSEDAVLYVEDDILVGTVVNNGSIEINVDGEVLMPFNNVSKGVVHVKKGVLKASGVLNKGAAYYVEPTKENEEHNHRVWVYPDAKFDINGKSDIYVSVKLENGAKVVNTLGNVGNGFAQTVQIVLAGDAEVNMNNEFGLVAPGHKRTRVNLGSYTLTLNGSKSFWMSNTSIDGSGTIRVKAGTLHIMNFKSNDLSGKIFSVVIESEGLLNIADNDFFLNVLNFRNDGKGVNGSGKLVVSGILTAGNPIPRLELTDGAAVRLTGVDKPQQVTREFIASGAVQVDASVITSDQWRTIANIPILSVPIAAEVENIPLRLYGSNTTTRRLYWESDGETQTLYLKNPVSGFMIYVR